MQENVLKVLKQNRVKTVKELAGKLQTEATPELIKTLWDLQSKGLIVWRIGKYITVTLKGYREKTAA